MRSLTTKIINDLWEAVVHLIKTESPYETILPYRTDLYYYRFLMNNIETHPEFDLSTCVAYGLSYMIYAFQDERYGIDEVIDTLLSQLLPKVLELNALVQSIYIINVCYQVIRMRKYKKRACIVYKSHGEGPEIIDYRIVQHSILLLEKMCNIYMIGPTKWVKRRLLTADERRHRYFFTFLVEIPGFELQEPNKWRYLMEPIPNREAFLKIYLDAKSKLRICQGKLSDWKYGDSMENLEYRLQDIGAGFVKKRGLEFPDQNTGFYKFL